MLTLNLLMNGLGLQFGAALKTEPAGRTSRALALATPKEIVAQWAAKGVVIPSRANLDSS